MGGYKRGGNTLEVREGEIWNLKPDSYAYIYVLASKFIPQSDYQNHQNVGQSEREQANSNFLTKVAK